MYTEQIILQDNIMNLFQVMNNIHIINQQYIKDKCINHKHT